MKAKKIALLGMLTAIAFVLSFIESFLDLSFLAPGVKIGLANAVTVVLVYYKKPLSALLVGVCRVLLSAACFGTPITLLYASLGFVFSFAVMFAVSKIKGASPFFISFSGGVFHNVGQMVAALIIYGNAMLAYLPILMLFGLLSGAFIGILCVVLCKNKTVKMLLME